jgi:hypothetical protein
LQLSDEVTICDIAPGYTILGKSVFGFFRFFAACVTFSGLLALSGAAGTAPCIAADIHSSSRKHGGSDAQLAEKSEASGDIIPAGTIIPMRLPSISSDKSKKGSQIEGKVAQDVPLPGGAKIHRGTTLLGEVVSSVRPTPGHGATLTIKFDALVRHGKPTPIRTNLRALASTLEIEDAQIPMSGPGESDVYDWLATQQIGGDVVYGKQGPVARGSRIVGQSTLDGVFAEVVGSADGRCRGAVAGNTRPQAVWVFSADACGLYGFGNLELRHAGQTEPFGEIVLDAKSGPVRIRSGSGALLRVD